MNFSCNDTGQHFKYRTERTGKHDKEYPPEAEMQRRIAGTTLTSTGKCKVYCFGEQRNSYVRNLILLN